MSATGFYRTPRINYDRSTFSGRPFFYYAYGAAVSEVIIDTLTGAGFELVGESDVNANPADQPSEEEFVWRLPPSFYGFGDNAELRAKYAKIGESNRMTLLFRKPE